jgi:hypothetical protein
MYLEHSFEELGIPLDGGWTFGSISGKCTVAYDSEGEWWIEDIWLDINKLTKGEWSRVSYLLDTTKPTERRWYHEVRSILAIVDRDVIEEKVAEELPDTYGPRSTISAGRTYS